MEFLLLTWLFKSVGLSFFLSFKHINPRKCFAKSRDVGIKLVKTFRGFDSSLPTPALQPLFRSRSYLVQILSSLQNWPMICVTKLTRSQRYYTSPTQQARWVTTCGMDCSLQLFWERLSEEVHATIPRGSGFGFTVLQKKNWKNSACDHGRMFASAKRLKEDSKTRFYSYIYSVLIISHNTFRDCRVHIFPTAFFKIAVCVHIYKAVEKRGQSQEC